MLQDKLKDFDLKYLVKLNKQNIINDDELKALLTYNLSYYVEHEVKSMFNRVMTKELGLLKKQLIDDLLKDYKKKSYGIEGYGK